MHTQSAQIPSHGFHRVFRAALPLAAPGVHRVQPGPHGLHENIVRLLEKVAEARGGVPPFLLPVALLFFVDVDPLELVPSVRHLLDGLAHALQQRVEEAAEQHV